MFVLPKQNHPFLQSEQECWLTFLVGQQAEFDPEQAGCGSIIWPYAPSVLKTNNTIAIKMLTAPMIPLFI
jgi:hypothetical protein